MKTLILLLALLMSFYAFAESNKDNKKKGYDFHPEPISLFDVIPLNSPVKESNAKFLIKVPAEFEVDEVQYRIKNASRIFDKDTPNKKIELINGPQGNELHISVSKLPPGFYQLFVKIKDKKNKEHEFKTKYKDHVKFVIDNILEVKMPDPKINNATILGVDSDNDGIRDDVQRWINENFSNKPLELKLAAKQYAIDIQSAMPTSGDQSASIPTTHAVLKSQSCLAQVGISLGLSKEEGVNIRKKIKLTYMNTIERIQSELKTDENFHGELVKSVPKESSCKF